MHPPRESLNTLFDVLQEWNEYLRRTNLEVSEERQVPHRNRRASPELVEHILHLSLSGSTSSQIAKLLNLKDYYVRSVVRRASCRPERREALRAFNVSEPCH